MFHGNVLESKDLKNDLILPQEPISTTQFKHFIEYYLERDYCFVSPDDILQGIDELEEKNHVMITFDDGYYNNVVVLPILKEFDIPALFFVTSNNVRYSKSFWGDAVYRELRKRNVDLGKILAEIERLKNFSFDQIEAHIKENFGEDALIPVSDIDRPFSAKELKEFSAEPLVFLGNHTENHAILPNYSDREVFSEISNAQKSIHEMTGIFPESIAYPNGGISNRVVDITRRCGLKLGFTVFPKKNKPVTQLNNNDLLRINRFMVRSANTINEQLDLNRSDIQLEGEILKLFFRLKYK